MANENGGSKADSEEQVKIPEPDAMKLAYEDANRSIETSIEIHQGHSNKAIQLMKTNGLMLTIILAATSQVDISQFLNLATLAAVLSFFLSSMLAGFGYFGQDVLFGIGKDGIQSIFDKKLTKKQYLAWRLTKVYPSQIDNIQDNVDTKTTFIKLSISSLISGLILIFVGILIPIA